MLAATSLVAGMARKPPVGPEWCCAPLGLSSSITRYRWLHARPPSVPHSLYDRPRHSSWISELFFCCRRGSHHAFSQTLACLIQWTPSYFLLPLRNAYFYLNEHVLQSTVEWLMGSPAGFQMNKNLAKFVGKSLPVILRLNGHDCRDRAPRNPSLPLS